MFYRICCIFEFLCYWICWVFVKFVALFNAIEFAMFSEFFSHSIYCDFELCYHWVCYIFSRISCHLILLSLYYFEVVASLMQSNNACGSICGCLCFILPRFFPCYFWPFVVMLLFMSMFWLHFILLAPTCIPAFFQFPNIEPCCGE